MHAWKNHWLRTILASIVAPLLLCFPLVGCSGGSKASQEKSPEEIEESRQEHIDMSNRERSGR
jgi:hypothetical protein